MPTNVAERIDIMSSSKRISISEKRQLTIPKSMFVELGFTDKAECVVKNGALILTPVQPSNGEFATEILADLIEQGYSGKELLEKFKETQAKVRPAVKRMLKEAHKLAESSDGSDDFDEIFS